MHSTTSEPHSVDDGNPYAAPAAAPNRTPLTLGERIGSALAASSEKYEAIGRAMVKWELLRIPYNMILLVPTSVGAWMLYEARRKMFLPQDASILNEVLLSVFRWYLFANLCFLLGHLFEGYPIWLYGRPCNRWVTVLLFVGGTAVASYGAFEATWWAVPHVVFGDL